MHGSGIGVNGWRNFGGNLGDFADDYHCYILEFPGFGASDPVPGAHPARVDKLVAIGGVGTNIFSPGPSEGTRLLREFADSPSREGAARSDS